MIDCNELIDSKPEKIPNLKMRFWSRGQNLMRNMRLDMQYINREIVTVALIMI